MVRLMLHHSRTNNHSDFYRSRIPEVTALVCFICYTLITGERLTVAKAFTSLALFSNLQQPMMELPQQLLALLHGKWLFVFSLLWLTAIL
jgi:hypothetical protein